MNQTPEQKLAAARERMAELAVKFIERSRGEMAVIRSRLAALGADDSGALAEIRNLAHRMCGTGATLGFEALADRAHDVEKMCIALADRAALDAAALDGFQRQVDLLGEEVRQLGSRVI
jgi:HPt (histidine-containing phosphotransfer) domain-containing protein